MGRSTVKNPRNRVACLGLTLNGAFGLASSIVAAANLRPAISVLDASGLVAAAFILALSCRREENQAAPSGF
jgi:hypothetical protein